MIDDFLDIDAQTEMYFLDDLAPLTRSWAPRDPRMEAAAVSLVLSRLDGDGAHRKQHVVLETRIRGQPNLLGLCACACSDRTRFCRPLRQLVETWGNGWACMAGGVPVVNGAKPRLCGPCRMLLGHEALMVGLRARRCAPSQTARARGG